MIEVWKDINFYFGYQVSNNGSVRSIDRVVDRSDGRKVTLKGKILKYRLCRNGYPLVSINQKNYSVYRLVAQSFIPNPENKNEVNHKNAIKFDCRVDNLEWCTRNENVSHAKEHDLYPRSFGKNNKLSKKVNQIDKENNLLIKTWDSISDAKRELGIDTKNIVFCCQDKYKSAGGYKWKYC